MKTPGKNPKNRKITQGEVHLRKKYTDPSRQFHNWVKALDLEKNTFTRWLLMLDQRFNVKRVGLLFVFCLILSFVLFFKLDLSFQARLGQVAPKDIKSPISFEIIDEVATAAKRFEEERAVPHVFDYDSEAFEDVYNRISRAFAKMRSEVYSFAWPDSKNAMVEKVKEFSLINKEAFEKDIGIKINTRLFEWLVKQKFSARLENQLIAEMDKWSVYMIIDDNHKLGVEEGGPNFVKAVPLRNGADEFTVEINRLKKLGKSSDFPRDFGDLNRAEKKDKEKLYKIVEDLMVSNLTFNRKETLARKKHARESVLPVRISIKKDQVIVRGGAETQDIHVRILEEVKNLQSGRRAQYMPLAAALLFLVSILVFFSYLRRFTLNRVKVTPKDITVMGVVTLLVLLITQLFLFMTDAAFIGNFGSWLPSTVFMFAAPIAAGPMLVGLLITSGEVVWLFSIFLAAALGIMVDMNFTFLLVAIIGGIAAARGVFSCKKRNDIYWAGLRTGLINFTVIALMMILSGYKDGNVLQQILWNAPAGFLGGVLSSMMAMMLIPLLESAFNYTTDVKLLELSNLNHPLMQQLMMKAPGTYHHCMSVSTMVDAAAKEIGANSLLAKVMAMYHDIGKMEHSQYFAENQKGYNPHDHISPYMSKTILVAHVKDGAEMGLKYKLGEPIIDGILQHHGTSMISYFYNRAVEDQDQDSGHVDENEFRYPGPKPQFKEAALVMLADGIEATARSLDEPTQSRLNNIVKNIIQRQFMDGQLDECNLTLRDLSVIEQAFRKTILAIYHQRMEYPHMRDGKVVSVAKPKKTAKKGPHTA